jgi:hypothetical protein
MSEQFSFLAARWPKSKAPRRADALALLEKLLPWDDFEAMLRPHYLADTRKFGRKGYSLRMMARCWVVACVWRLSDDGLVNLILDSLAVAKFIGCDPWQPRPPSESAFRNFRHLVENAGLSLTIRTKIDAALAEAGIQWRQGAIVEPVFKRARQGEESGVKV